MADTVIEALEAEAKPYYERHADGVYLRVKPNGMKDWQLRYKKPDGKWSWLGLGGYGKGAHHLLGKEAREKAVGLVKEAKGRGVSPLEAKTPPEADTPVLETFAQLSQEWLAIKKASWKADTYERAGALLDKHILPTMGERGYTAILASEWFNLFKGMESKGILETIAKARSYCRDIYALAQVTDRAQSNPIDNLHKFLAASQNENFPHVSPAETPELIRAVRGYRTRSISIGLQLLMLLACRPTELREAQWEEFDLDAGVWDVLAIRKKEGRDFVLPLPAQAIKLLRELHGYRTHSPFLFPGRSEGMKKSISDGTFNRALNSMGYKGRQTPHGMRHLFSTAANEAGKNYRIVDSALAHKVKGVEGVYNKATYLTQRRELLQWWADQVDALASELVKAA